ncbi:hypothetical protein D3C83_32120 [compost metagenome]
MTTGRGAIGAVAGLVAATGPRFAALRFAAGLRRVAAFFFFAAFLFPARFFAFAIQLSSRLPRAASPVCQ